jgi:uncharacterized protein (TIGR00288 family)
MNDKLNIAVFVDYDNIEIGVKSTLRREFRVAPVLDALKERGVIVAKFAYANWGRQEPATRQMAENAVQMVQRIPSPRGDKNGADINLALDAMEMAFTHPHVNAFAIVSGDSDFIPLVNKLKEYGKTVFIVGGKAFTSTILQQNCHEFVSYESMLDDMPVMQKERPREQKREGRPQGERTEPREREAKEQKPQEQQAKPAPEQRQDKPKGGQQGRPAALDLSQALPLVERALEVLERRAVQPQLGLLKSTMLQLSPSFNEKAFGARSFSEFVDLLKKGDYVHVSGSGGRYVIERKRSHAPDKIQLKPEDALPFVRDVLEDHRLDMEDGVAADQLRNWVGEEKPELDWTKYGFQEFNHLLNFAQDRTVVRLEPDEERGLIVYLGAEFYPPAPPPQTEEEQRHEYDDRQPFVEGQPTIFEPDPKPVSPRARKKTATPRKAVKKTAARRKP